MTSIIPLHKPSDNDIIKIEKEGVYGNKTQQEYKHNLKWESLKDKASEAKSFDGYLKGRIKVARFENNEDVSKLLEFLLEEYRRYQRLGKIKIKGWKGKSSFDYFKFPDKVIITKFAKNEKDEVQKGTDYIISVHELNGLLTSLNICQNICKDQLIPTSLIAEHYCNVLGITKTSRGEDLFNIDSSFNYSAFFRWRIFHYRLTLMLNFLDKEQAIVYRKRGTKVINTNFSIQEIL